MSRYFMFKIIFLYCITVKWYDTKVKNFMNYFMNEESI